MITSFADKTTQYIWTRRYVKRIDRKIQRIALRKLEQIHAATTLMDLRIPPGNNLEHLLGDRRGQYSIRVNDQWRICFNWIEGEARNVELVDYHR